MTTAALPEVLKNVRRLEITARRMVNDVFAGQYSSTFKGRGMEFAEVREYLPGDDVRTIDWNVTARLGHPYVKKFIEERELTVLFLLDQSASLSFGTRAHWKSERAAEITALLAFSALRNNDKVGLLLFTDRVERYIPPRKNRGHALRLIREVVSFNPVNKGTSLRVALEYLNRVQRRRAIVFLISDFLDQDYETPLRIAQRRHDVVAIPLLDSWEENPPRGVRLLLRDEESGAIQLTPPHSAWLTQRRESLRRQFRRWEMDSIFVDTETPYIQSFIRFFHERARRRH